MFTPVATETSGAVGTSCLEFIKELDRRVRQVRGEGKAHQYPVPPTEAFCGRAERKLGLCPGTWQLICTNYVLLLLLLLF